MKTKIILLLVAVLLLTSAAAVAAEKPAIGVCIIFSPNILGDRDNQASLTIKDAVFSKFSAAKYKIAAQVTPADFKNYLGKKEILVNEIPQMMSAVKLLTFVEYGEQKQLDYLTVVFCQAVTHKSASGSVPAESNRPGTTATNSATLIKKAELITRVVVVDVKRQAYLYNLRLDKSVDDDNGFRTEVRAIKAAAKEYVQDFARQINPADPQ